MSSSKRLIWIGRSLDDLKEFPEEVKDEIGYALHQVQSGDVPLKAKQLKGLRPAVMEIVSNYDTNSYRSVYTVKIGHSVYVLHCFQKKSKTGIKTPKNDIDIIKQRLKDAKYIDQQIGNQHE